VARPRYPKSDAPLPQPLSPAERTVGQVVAESLRFYGGRFWACLALGVPIGVLNVLGIELSGGARLVVLPPAGAILLSVTFVAASALRYGLRPAREELGRAFAVGLLVFAPFELLVALYILPGLAWVAFVGLAVPALLVEHLSPRAAIRRGVELACADYVHALGSLATLFLVLFLTQSALYASLATVGDQAAAAASFLAGLVISPVLLLGAALLYEDQAARIDSPQRPRRKRDADLPDADDAHREGRPDPEVEPRAPA